MATKSMIGRFLVLAVSVVSLGIVAQAAVVIMGGGKAAKSAHAEAQTVAQAASPSQSPAPLTTAEADPVRVVYPGPVAAPAAKFANPVPASPLDAPATATSATASPATPTAPTPAVDAAPASATAPAAVASSAVPAAAPASAPLPATPPAPTSEAASAAPQPAPAETAAPSQGATVQVASLGAAVPTESAAAAGAIDINTASVAELDRLGGGHIGHSIATHRPYHSVEDLVRKRVLRRSVYEQIKDRIAAQ